jgi:hypothetical protein
MSKSNSKRITRTTIMANGMWRVGVDVVGDDPRGGEDSVGVLAS